MVLSETALFHYKCTEFYAPAAELTLRWNDPDLGIEWPVKRPRFPKKMPAACVCATCRRSACFPDLT